jgi:hypothetical protein
MFVYHFIFTTCVAEDISQQSPVKIAVFLYHNTNLLLLLLAFTTPLRVLASLFLRFRDHTQGHTTVGRTPLDE